MSTKRKFSWEYYASVEQLSKKFKLSKRRIQQLLLQLRNEGQLDAVVGVFPDVNNPIGFSIKPLYARIN